MSGYGQGVAEGEGLQISFELRSVNHRFFRLGLHLPAGLSFFETTARQLISDRVQRVQVAYRMCKSTRNWQPATLNRSPL